MNPIWRNILTWLMIVLLIGGFYQMMSPHAGMQGQLIPYSDFLSQAGQGQVKKAVLQGSYISGTYHDGRAFRTLKPEGTDVTDKLIANGVTVEAKPLESGMSGLFGVLLSWFPMLLLIGVWIFFMRQMQGKNGGGAMGFGRSRAKMLTEKTNKEV